MTSPPINELVPYLFSGADNAEDAPSPVRIVMRNEAPWFVAADICRVLGIKNSRDTLAKCLDDEEKGVDTIYTPGGPQTVQLVSESGLYALIFRSRKPIARKFRRWVTEEVLPSIRRTGRYENTVPVGRHPQGPSLTLGQVEASLHQHQMRVLAAVRAIAEDGRAQVTGFGQIADLAGLSVANVQRAVRLLVSLGFIEINDGPTADKLTALDPPAGRA